MTPEGPRVEPDAVTFTVADPEHELVHVRLYQEITRPRNGPDFERDGDAWTLSFPRPRADRMEYLVQIAGSKGDGVVGPDMSNPLTAPGPFGDKSVVQWPEYEAPQWLDEDAVAAAAHEEVVDSRILKASLPVVMMTFGTVPADDKLPLLIVHDGPEFDRYSGLGHFLSWAVESGRFKPLRAALLAPVNRNETYSASAAYARSFAAEILPELTRVAPWPDGQSPVGMGASLGALAMLHIQRLHPDIFGGLLLQSGSFFKARLDEQESSFVRFQRITRFVGSVTAGRDTYRPIPVAITAGTAEENMHNNRALAEALDRQGYEVSWREHPDAHNWISWRDSFGPALMELLPSVWDG